MADGSSHRIYSENHKDLLGWYEDITRMCIKSKGADGMSSEDEFVILENSNNNLICKFFKPFAQFLSELTSFSSK